MRPFIVTSITLVFVAAITAIVVYVIPLPYFTPEQRFAAQAIVARIGNEGWNFLRPLLQLAVVLAIIQWFFTRNGITFRVPLSPGWQWDTRTLIASAIIFTFCISVLIGIESNALQNVALVVVGFYFGTIHQKQLGTSPKVGNEAEATPSGHLPSETQK